MQSWELPRVPGVQRTQLFLQGAQGSPGKLDTCRSIPREEGHVAELHLPSGGCQGNKDFDFSSAKWGDGNIFPSPVV